jgi:hypothetical protein
VRCPECGWRGGEDVNLRAMRRKAYILPVGGVIIAAAMITTWLIRVPPYDENRNPIYWHEWQWTFGGIVWISAAVITLLCALYGLLLRSVDR